MEMFTPGRACVVVDTDETSAVAVIQGHSLMYMSCKRGAGAVTSFAVAA